MSTATPPRALRPVTRPLVQSAGQRRQQLDLAGVALQQHLRDARGRAEVAVDLERRMGAEQVRIDAGAAADVVGRGVAGRPQKHPYQAVRAGGVPEPRPQVDLPGQRPASGLVAAQVECARGRCSKGRRTVRRDRVTGMQADQV